eukprot:987876_1
MFSGQLRALLYKHWLKTIRRPVGTALLVLVPTCFIISGFFTGIARRHSDDIFPFLFVGAFVRAVGDIVEEKENRIKEGMKMMGLKESVLVLSHCIAEIVRYALLSLLCAALAMLALYPENHAWFLPLYLFMFQLSLLAKAYCLASCINKSRYAGFIAIFVHLISVIGTFVLRHPSKSIHACMAEPVCNFSTGINNLFNADSEDDVSSFRFLFLWL